MPLITNLNYAISGLTAGTSYNVEVRAVDAAGNEGPGASSVLTTKNFNIIMKHTKQTGFIITLSPLQAFDLKWGDGQQQAIPIGASTAYTHDYAAAGNYAVEITAALLEISNLNVSAQNVYELDLRKIKVGGMLQFNGNQITEPLFSASNAVFTRFWGYDNPELLRCDSSMLSGLGGNIQMQNNTKMSSWLLPVTTQAVSLLQAMSCTSLTSLDFSGLQGGVTGNFNINGCTNLATLVDAPSYTGQRYWAQLCKLNRVFELGTVIKCTDIDLKSNGMSQANVDATINNLYANRGSISGAVKLQIGGANAAPSAAAITKINELNAAGDTITYTAA